MRRPTTLGVLVFANFATAGLGRYLSEDGKLSVSNLSPVLFVLAAMPLFLAARRTLSRSMVGFLLLFNLLAWVSFLIFACRFGWKPNFAVLYFQELEIVFCALLLWYARLNPDEFRTMVKVGTLCSAVISAWYGYDAIMSGAAFQIVVFSMDDKSQAAVLFCCQAFILMRYFKGVPEYFAAVALMAMSLITLSREPVFFVPVVFAASVLRSKSGALLGVVAAMGILAFMAYASDVVGVLFKVFDRLSSVDTVASEGSTTAHVLLIQAALQVKFSDAVAFIFGTGPGNFAYAISSFPISLSELDAVDPIVIQEARVGRAPMHSTPFSAMLDYNLLVFCLLGYLLLWFTYHLIKKRKHMELFFFFSLFGASAFYSIHNKPYVYLLCTTIFILMSSEKTGGRRKESTSNRVPSIVLPDHEAEGHEYG